MEAKLKLNPLCLWDSRPLAWDNSESALKERGRGCWVTFTMETRTTTLKHGKKTKRVRQQRGRRSKIRAGMFLMPSYCKRKKRDGVRLEGRWSKEGGDISRRKGCEDEEGFSLEGFPWFSLLRPGKDASPWHTGTEFGPGLCIIYEHRHILRLNICWFVKSTNMRSCPSPWHISSANGKHCRTFNWWEQRLVTWTPAALPSLPPSFLLLLWRRTEKKGKGRWGGVGGGGGCVYERGRHWAKAGLKVTASHCEGTASRKALCTYLRSLVFMFSFTLKCQQHTWRQRWIAKQAEGGKAVPFVKTVPLC